MLRNRARLAGGNKPTNVSKMTETTALVTTKMFGAVALVTMDDGKANAASHQLLEALENALDSAEAEAKAVVLAGRSGKFCAGFDLRVMQGAGAEERAELSRRGGLMVHRLYGYPLPLVAASTGHAIALGAILLLACDTRVGPTSGFKFGLNETAIGLPLPTFGTELAKDRLHPAHLTQAVVQSRIYDPEGAVSAGFLDVLAPEANVVETAIALAQQLVQLPTAAYAANKRKVREATLELVGSSLAI